MSKRNMSENSVSKAKMSRDDIREHDISKEKAQKPAAGKTGHSGGSNVTMLRASVAILMLLCGMLLIRIRSLNQTIEALTSKTDKLMQIVMEQRDALEELTEKLSAAGNGQGSPQAGQAGDSGQVSPVSGRGEAGNGSKDSSGTGQGSGQNPTGTGEEITAAHKVYLTFDDGPSANTQDILDILDRYDVKATFFVVGGEGDAAEETLKRIVEAGHTLGMHSYTHKYSEIYESVDSFAEDFTKQQELIYDVTGVKSTVYRFPGGSSNSVSDIDMKEFAEYLDSQGVRFFDWNISSGDGGSQLVPVETLIENCTENISRHSTSIILMHDVPGKTTTREALPKIIEKIQAMDDTVLLPITDETEPVQHIKWQGE